MKHTGCLESLHFRRGATVLSVETAVNPANEWSLALFIAVAVALSLLAKPGGRSRTKPPIRIVRPLSAHFHPSIADLRKLTFIISGAPLMPKQNVNVRIYRSSNMLNICRDSVMDVLECYTNVGVQQSKLGRPLGQLWTPQTRDPSHSSSLSQSPSPSLQSQEGVPSQNFAFELPDRFRHTFMFPSQICGSWHSSSVVQLWYLNKMLM